MIIKPEEYDLIYCNYTKTPKRRVLKREYEKYGFNRFSIHKTPYLDFNFHLWLYVGNAINKDNIPEYPWIFLVGKTKSNCYFFTKSEFDKFLLDFILPEDKILKSFDKVEDLPIGKPISIFLWGSIFASKPASKSTIIKSLCDRLEIKVSKDNAYSSVVLRTFFKRNNLSYSILKDIYQCPICEIEYNNIDKKYFLLADDCIKYIKIITNNMN